ncbi:LYR motif-containing protein 4B-like [Sinocyclocheilus anshuiensis]|uniref:LYR motif-containing protein 4B-like n=1 Tax=Sinocyclocheilus anshuiensis TaxID=1608454 RepID=A0A671M4R5_9TELE|nr:PREDICTED: LYR motif-containing protein 4B-like [Sinocyclocheilus anshuiensis]
MAASSREHVLSLYRLLLKASKTFPSYNYRTYALRRVRDAFRENRTVEDPKVVEELLNRARDSLALIQRQVCIGKMFAIQKTVVEQEEKKSD